MLRMSPLPVEGKLLNVAARLAELTEFVNTAARDGLQAHELERGLWHSLLRLGHDLQAGRIRSGRGWRPRRDTDCAVLSDVLLLGA